MILFFAIALLLEGISLAGSWSSSGGELVGISRNPWFVNNTEKVSYCFDIEPEVPLPEAAVEKAWRKALAYWQREFSSVLAPQGYQGLRVHLGFQQFLRVPCTGSQDIRVWLGGAIAGSKVEPHQFIAQTVLTDYDSSNLRGRGYIQISHQTEEAQKALRSEVLLAKVLTHELGHVFGIGHTSRFPDEVMDSRFVHRQVALSDKEADEPLPPFFRNELRPWDRSNVCLYPEAFLYVAAYLKLDPSTRCIRTRLSRDNTLEFLGRDTNWQPEYTLAAATLEHRDWVHFESPIEVVLPKQQAVFPQLTGKSGILLGPRRYFETRSGLLTLASGETRMLSVSDHTGDERTFVATLNDRLIPNLFAKGTVTNKPSNAADLFPREDSRNNSLRRQIELPN